MSDDLAKLARLARHMNRRRIETAHMSLTRPQAVVAEAMHRFALWRDGNRLGKSEKLARIAGWCGRSTHPYWDPFPFKGPINIAVGGVTLDQMEPMARKLWDLLPKDEIDPRFTYDPGRGFTGKPPRIPFIAGPGKGNLMKFFTYEQGPKRIAGDKIHVLLLDEPPPQHQWEELLPRVLDTGGIIRIGMTPTPEMPPQLYMKELVDNGVVHEFNYGLAEENCWPAAAPVPYLLQPEIDDFEASFRPAVREMRMRGAWEGGVEGRRIPAFSALNIRNDPPLAGSVLTVGIDHGLQSGKQTAYVSAVRPGQAKRGVLPRVWTMAGYRGEGESSDHEDAVGILDAIESIRVGGRSLGWRDIDHWVGDRSVGSGRKGAYKSNARLRSALVTVIAERERRRDPDSPWASRELVERAFPEIVTPHKYPGSVDDDADFLNALLASSTPAGVPCVIVYEQLTHLHEATRRWKGGAREEWKDAIDGWRYGVMYAIDRADRESVMALYAV